MGAGGYQRPSGQRQCKEHCQHTARVWSAVHERSAESSAGDGGGLHPAEELPDLVDPPGALRLHQRRQAGRAESFSYKDDESCW